MENKPTIIPTDKMFIVIISIILVVVLMYLEYNDQDCINGKPCGRGIRSSPIPESPKESIDTLIGMVRKSTRYVNWRLSLAAALLLSAPVAYLVVKRFPTLSEWVIVALLIFLGTYFSASWLWTHWVHPNSRRIEQTLLMLKERL